MRMAWIAWTDAIDVDAAREECAAHSAAMMTTLRTDDQNL
jgi:hypothetical protein